MYRRHIRRLSGFVTASVTLLISNALFAAAPVVPTLTLDQAMKSARWNTERQGPLLIVDPAHTKLMPGRSKVPASDIERASLRALAGNFGRKLVSLGSLTVLAPTTMILIGPPAGPPTPAGALEDVDPLRYLLATLKPEQWEEITSDSGLPATALSPQQQVWLDHIVPTPGTLYTTNAARASRRPLTTADRDRSRLRLSREVLLSLSDKELTLGGGLGFRGLWLNHGTSVAPVYMVNADEDDEAKDHKLIIRRVVPSAEKTGDLDLRLPGENAAALSRSVSLAPDADGKLTLGTLIQRAAKVTRIELYADGRVANLPLLCRTGPNDTAVRAGDILRALCWGITGTFRRVGPAQGPAAYVLTDDLEGIGSRVARIVEWERAASVLSDSAEANAQETIKTANVGNLVKYAPDDPFALPNPLMLDMLRRNAAQYGDGPYAARHSQGEDLSFTMDQLPSAFRQFAEEQAKKAAADSRNPIELRTERARIEPGLYLALLLPDGGIVRAKEVMEGEVLNNALTPSGVLEKADTAAETPSPVAADAPPLPSLAEIQKPVVLAASATSADAARSLVREARRYGFAQIWLQTPPTVPGREALAAAVEEGQAQAGLGAVPVWAAAPLLRSEEASAEAAPLGSVQYDQNILGDTSSQLARRRAGALDIENSFTHNALRFLLSKNSDFLRFDTPVLASARIGPVLDLAGVPGLAGIALSDTAPPGYTPPFEKSSDWYDGLQDSGDFGYSPETRLAFLRQQGYDPLDLSLNGTDSFSLGSADLPFFPSKEARLFVRNTDGESPADPIRKAIERWIAFRRERNEKFLGTLYQKLRGTSPKLPLMMAERSNGTNRGPEFWATWDAAEKLPYDREITARSGLISSKDPHAISKTVYSVMAVPPNDTLATIADHAANLGFYLGPILNPSLGVTLRADGLIVDLRSLSLEKTEEFLKRALKPLPDNNPVGK